MPSSENPVWNKCSADNTCSAVHVHVFMPTCLSLTRSLPCSIIAFSDVRHARKPRISSPPSLIKPHTSSPPLIHPHHHVDYRTTVCHSLTRMSVGFARGVILFKTICRSRTAPPLRFRSEVWWSIEFVLRWCMKEVQEAWHGGEFCGMQ